jgi:hypothetical protein
VVPLEFLGPVFPPSFPFGIGAIGHAIGATWGQLDVVVEFPFLPSFPTPGAAECLYLAYSAALIIEVKLDLSGQWSQIRECAFKGANEGTNFVASEHSFPDRTLLELVRTTALLTGEGRS